MQKVFPLVTIFCPTFNHEKYLRQCFDGLLMQQTHFQFEILVHDDASTDRTQDVIREYENRYPDLFRCIYQKENQFSKDTTYITKIVFTNAKGKYIAFCEGDDYWTDPLKLQKQVDFLEKNEEYSACFHRYELLDSDNKKINEDKFGFLFQQNTIEGVEINKDIFLKNWVTQPVTMVLRKSMMDASMFKKYKFFRDAHLLYHLISAGKFFLFGFNAAVYRLHTGGLHSKKKMQELCDTGINVSKELYQFNKDKPLKDFLIRNLDWGIGEYIKNEYDNKKLFFYILQHFQYSFSCRKLLKRLFIVFTKSIKNIFIKKNKIIIQPIGGLANRMRVIASALKMKQKYNCTVRCYWVENDELNAPFNKLFEDIEDIKVYAKPSILSSLSLFVNNIKIVRKVSTLIIKVLGIDHYFRDSDFKDRVMTDKINIEDSISKKKNIFIHSCEEFCENEDMYDYFQVKKNLQTKISAITNNFTNNTIGIHIRRTDNIHSIEKSPVELFVKKMQDEIAKNSDVSFFLSTDDLVVENEFKNLFKERIFTYSKEFSRQTVEGMQDAVIEMYCLSKTSKIYGSYWTSFSIIASRIGKIEFTELKK